MRYPVRFLAAFGLLLGLVAATAIGAGAGTPGTTSTFEVTVYTCSTTDDALAGETEFLIGFTADQLDCVAQELADGVTVSLYDGDDNHLDSGTTSGGTTTLDTLVMSSLAFYLGEDFHGDASDEDTIGEGENALVTIILFIDADGELLITKTDEETSAPIAGAGFTLYTDECQTEVAAEQLTDALGEALFSDILAGDYCVIETTPPDGYLAIPAPVSVTIFGGETTDLSLTNEPDAPPPPGAVAIAKYACVDNDLAGTVEFYVDAEIDVAACDVGVGYLIGLVDTTTTGEVDSQTTGEDGTAFFDQVAPGNYVVTEGSEQSLAFDVAAEGEVAVQIVNYIEEQAGQVLVSAFLCEGTESAVEIEVSDPIALGAQGDDELCQPIAGLQVFIYPFGDEDTDPVTGTTGDDGTILFDGIPPTDGQTGPHLFRTIIFDSDFDADFDVGDDALTAITVLVFEPAPPAPTNTPGPTNTPVPAGPTSTAAPTGTISTLPGTGAGEPLGPGGGAAWLLIVSLGLLGFGAIGYTLRRRVA